MFNWLIKLKNFKNYKKYFEKLIKIILYYIFICSKLPKSNMFLIGEQYIESEHDIDKKKLSYYLVFMDLIEGWFYKEAAQLFLLIDYIQKKEGITGNIFEIGAHHGKSAIMLGLMIDQKKEKLGLCDIFSRQEYNISNSGKGNKESLYRNLNSFFNDISFIQVFEKPSKELTVKDCNECRFFHIDGGHTLDETYNDINLANDSILEKGIIAVDDFYNSSYPEVMSGVNKFIKKNNSLVPLLLGFNKLFLCRQNQKARYLERLCSYDWRRYIRKSGLQLKEKNLDLFKVHVFGRYS